MAGIESWWRVGWERGRMHRLEDFVVSMDLGMDAKYKLMIRGAFISVHVRLVRICISASAIPTLHLSDPSVLYARRIEYPAASQAHLIIAHAYIHTAGFSHIHITLTSHRK